MGCYSFRGFAFCVYLFFVINILSWGIIVDYKELKAVLRIGRQTDGPSDILSVLSRLRGTEKTHCHLLCMVDSSTTRVALVTRITFPSCPYLWNILLRMIGSVSAQSAFRLRSSAFRLKRNLKVKWLLRVSGNRFSNWLHRSLLCLDWPCVDLRWKKSSL